MRTSTLLTADPSAAAKHLQASAAQLGIKEVTEQLLAKIAVELLPPRIFRLWLAAGGGSEAICQGLRFQHSQAVRRASIAHFGKLFRTKHLQDVWNAVGGTAGIVEYFAAASVCDVRSFCNHIRRSATTVTSATARVALVDELYESLRQSDESRAAFKSSDRRPLSSLYHGILPACSQQTVVSAVDHKSGIQDAGKGEAAFFAHTAMFRSRCLCEIQDPSIEVDMRKVRTLLRIGSNDRGTLRDPGVSGNSQFALEVLEALSTRREIKGDAKAILSEIAMPLFRRLARRKCLPDTMTRATLAYVTFSQNHISSRTSLEDLCNGPGAFVIQSWGRCPERLEESLVTLLRLAPSQHLPEGGEWLTLVELVPKKLRIRLLGAVSRCDLTTHSGVEQSRLQWYSPLLLALPRDGARKILEQLIQSGSAGINEYYTRDRRQAEITLLRIQLHQGEPTLVQLATAAVDEQKKEANRAREQAHRGLCVSYVLQFAAASRCLGLYREVLLWTRKYIRDPLTAMEIFRGPSFSSDDCLGLLCGFPETKHECASTTLDQIALDVKEANVIITECVQTACLAQLEPDFKASHWRALLGLMGAVVCERYKRASVLQDALHLSDEDMFDNVWHNTLETCTALELLGLHDDNTSLEFNELGGPLMRNGMVLPKLTDPRPATLRFVDTLAETRNVLWEEHRRKQVPATLTLPEPYPRGLPLECLVPVDIEECNADWKLPYLLSRAEKIVFVSGDLALTSLPACHDQADAIGSFVENWRNALKVYISLSRNPPEAASAAWEHATGPLSATRMSALEAHIFWSPVFSSCLSHTDLIGPWNELPERPRSLQIPVVEDDQQLTEWSPETDVRRFEVKSRRLEPTRIDAMLHTLMIMTRTINTAAWPEPSPEIPSCSLEPFWSRWKHPRGVSSATREALVAAAILHVSEANLLSPGILSKPFPPGGDSRFPALFLDGEFLDREDPQRCNVFVWETMMLLSNDVPAGMLVPLIEFLTKASAGSKDRMPAHALKLLQVLTKGDRPQAALDLIQDLILDRPDDSSWHRLLLNKGLLNSLPKSLVEQFLRKLVAAIQTRLAEQANNNTVTPNSPHVKVTTVKMISQLLSGAICVDSSFACSVLTGLLANSTHIDIRVSLVESLLDILRNVRDGVLADDILSALELHVVPVMSGMNERAPMSREEWNSCNATDLPDLHMEKAGNLPPLIACVLSSVARLNESRRKQLFDRIILPTVFKNANAHGRWIRLFLESHGLGPVPLPNPPSHLQLLFELIKWPAYIPASIIDLWLQVLTAVIRPPPGVVAMNQLVSGNPKLLESSKGQHWSSIWGAPGRTVVLMNKTQPATMLSHDWRTVRQDDGLRVELVQNAVLQQLELMLPVLGSAMEDKSWASFIRDFEPPAWFSKDMGKWHRDIKPVLQQVVDKIEALRTPEWQRDAHRTPDTLPDTFLWRLWLLTPFPASADNNTRGEAINAFASSMSTLLSELCRSRRSYMKHYELLARFTTTSGTPTDRIRVALVVGDPDRITPERLDAAHDLRMDLTRQLLRSVRDPPPSPEAEELRGKVKTLLRQLAKCGDEETRRVGFSLLQDGLSSWRVGMAWYAGND